MQPARLEAALSAAMADTLLAGTLGLCVADAAGRVVRREGRLSGWAPEPGDDLFAHPVIECFREAVLALRTGARDMLLPGMGLPGEGGDLKIDIRFAWIEQGAWLVVTSTEAAARAAFDGAIAQARREQRILEERLSTREAQLAGQRRLMALFIAHVPAAIAMLDRSLRYVAVSDRWRQDFGLAAAATAPGASLAASLPGVSAHWRQGLEASLAGEESRRGLDQVTGAHGRVDWVRWRFMPWRLARAADEDGPEAGLLLFCEIVTETVEQARKLEEQARRLRAANVDMKNFSLALSHDLQAPVRQMVKFAGLVAGDAGEALAASSREFLGEIQAAGQRAQGMMAGLSRYLRVAARQPALARVKLADCLATALANLSAELAASQGRVEASDLPAVHGDRELLTMLFQNIIQNGLKYAGAARPLIKISARRDGDSWSIACTDNGPGLAPHKAAKAFDMFQRLDARQGIAGTGVGLAICRWIAGVHNGTIKIDATWREGLRLVFSLPAAAT